MRELLARELNACPDMEGHDAEFSSADSLKFVDALRPDIVFVDAMLPARGCFGLVSGIQQHLQPMTVGVLYRFQDIDEVEQTLLDCFRQRCEIFLSENEPTQTFVHIARTGCSFRGQGLQERWDEIVRDYGRHRSPIKTENQLTAKELEVLRLCADGLPNAAIAERLGISVFTVKNHVHNILKKLDCSSRLIASRLAYHKGWL